MKKIPYLFFILLLSYTSCKKNFKENQQLPLNVKTLVGEEGETVILGPMNRANLNTDEFLAWFEPSYKSQKVPVDWANEHLNLSEDTQRELGPMFKILDALNVHHNRIEMYGLSEFKDSPDRLEKKYEILNIPTLIFFENGIEINRIVEFPVVNLLDDFSKILKKQSYKNSYSDF